MPLKHEVLHRTVGPVRVSWTPRDTILYALGVGAGQNDPTTDLEYTTGDTPFVLPVFAVTLLQFHGPQIDLGQIEPAARLHAEQALSVYLPLPPSGSIDVTRSVTGIYDKGSAAIVSIESTATDPSTGAVLATALSNSFIRGEGGFGGPKTPPAPPAVPDTHPDITLTTTTRPEQALLYRLSGDYNSLHYSPAVAAQAGYSRPILHGLCTYGIAGRVLLQQLCGGEPRRFHGIFGRFTKAVLPGEALTVQVWRSRTNRAAFRVLDQSGAVVIDRGRFDFDERVPS